VWAKEKYGMEAAVAVEWSEAERRAWAPPEDIFVSEWAERHRMLPIKLSSKPGRWSNDWAPYTVEIMDSFLDPQVERITIMAAVQSSKSEAVYNMFGYAVDQDPAPMLIVMPTDKSTKKVNERITLMLEESPQLRLRLTGNPDDVKQKEINLKRMVIWFATAGSTADLRNVSARYLYLDEIDDYPPETGEQGSPADLAEARTTTWWNRKVIESSTPTVEEGAINKQYESSDRRKYWVPCPYCGGYQLFTFWQVKHAGEVLGQWPKDKRDPQYIKENRVARYECIHCKAEIDDKDKPWMLRYGTWVPEGHPIEPDGTVAIPRPRRSHRGYWWNALYSRWRTFSEAAAQFFATKNDPDKYRTFVNLWLAEPWKQVIVATSEDRILKARCELPPQTMPQEAVALVAGIDPGKYGYWFVVRAFARDYTSWLVHYGFLPTDEDLEELLFNSVYPVQGTDLVAPIWRAAHDTGGGEQEDDISITERTYLWLRRNGRGRGCRVWGTKGSSKPLAGKVHVGKPLDKTPSGKPIPGGLQLVFLDTEKLKDSFHYRLQQAIKQLPQGAYLYAETGSDYVSHILAEEKRRGKGGAEEWVQKSRDNHWLDCEVLALAAADPEWPRGGVNLLPRQFSRSLNGDDYTPAPAGPRVVRSRWMERGLR
jgi:phage terminase large subunit GpA-like protein